MKRYSPTNSKGAVTTAATSWDISRRPWSWGSSTQRWERAFPTFSSVDNDAQRASLYRRGGAGKKLWPCRAALLHQPARAVSGDSKAGGRAENTALRAGKERDHGDAGRRAHRRAGPQGAGRSGAHPRYRASRPQPACGIVPAWRDLHG